MNYTDDELRVKIAEIKGIKPDHGCWQLKGNTWYPLPAWHTDIATAYALEEEIMEISEQVEYVRILTRIINPTLRNDVSQRFAMVHATARQRCEAWLILKEKKE